jgi:Tfp pilus assembly protein PilV
MFSKSIQIQRSIKATKCPKQRSGLSLLEVILSVAILGVSMVLIGNLYHLGYRSALKARMISEANLMAGSTMAELAAGVLPIESSGDAAVPGNPNWTYSVDIQSSLQPGLFMATVTVKRQGTIGQVPASVSIVRFIPDPDYEPEEDEE